MMQRKVGTEPPLSHTRRTSPLRRVREAWRGLKLPLPHSHVFVVGGFALYLLLQLVASIYLMLKNLSLPEHSWGSVVITAVVVLLSALYAILTLLRIGLSYADSFLREYGFAVKGEEFAREVELAPPQKVRIDELHKLAGKALLITLNENTDFSLVPPPRAFCLHKPLSPPRTLLRVRLYGVEAEREVTLLDTAFDGAAQTRFETVSWGAGKRMVIPIEAEFPSYALEFDFADAAQLIAQEVVCTKRLRLALGVALRRQDIARCSESSVEDAQLVVSNVAIGKVDGEPH